VGSGRLRYLCLPRVTRASTVTLKSRRGHVWLFRRKHVNKISPNTRRIISENTNFTQYRYFVVSVSEALERGY
jgi:hypothetical protein